jgi:uncharacterized protein (TIGR03083 family)
VSDGSRFSVGDFDALSGLVLSAWGSGVALDWSVPAGTLEWSCFTTADHTVDCVFSYAFFLASRAQDGYPPFSELHALPGATPSNIVDGLRASCTLLSSAIRTAAPDVRAILYYRPEPTTGSPPDFAARGAHELILHAHDVCTGLGIPFDPPRDLCRRLRDHTRDWPYGTAVTTDDPWSDLLERSGRARAS